MDNKFFANGTPYDLTITLAFSSFRSPGACTHVQALSLDRREERWFTIGSDADRCPASVAIDMISDDGQVMSSQDIELTRSSAAYCRFVASSRITFLLEGDTIFLHCSDM